MALLGLNGGFLLPILFSLGAFESGVPRRAYAHAGYGEIWPFSAVFLPFPPLLAFIEPQCGVCVSLAHHVAPGKPLGVLVGAKGAQRSPLGHYGRALGTRPLVRRNARVAT